MFISTKKESELIDQLRRTISENVKDVLDKTTIDDTWCKNINKFCELVLTSDPKEFLQWDVILRTMVVGNADFVRDELNFLKSLSDWKGRWLNAIEESLVGNPTLYDDFPSSSGNLIHQAYHLAQFEKKTGMDISQASFIFEFGGGYGSMCKLVHNLNFKGRYVIFDLPPLSALQSFFLNMNRISAISYNEYLEINSNGVICVSEFEQLKTIISDNRNISDAVFIANWSLSESPINLRHSILPLVRSFKAFLVAYQGLFGDIDNVKFFEEELVNANKNIKWHNWKIKHLSNQRYRDNYYLMGNKI